MYVAQMYVSGVERPLYRAAVYGLDLGGVEVPVEAVRIEFVALNALRNTDRGLALGFARRAVAMHASRRPPWGDPDGPMFDLTPLPAAV